RLRRSGAQAPRDRDDDGGLGAPHRVHLRRARRQRPFAPALAAILAGEHLAAAGRAVHALGLTLVEGDGEHRGLRLHAHVRASPPGAAVLATEEHTDLALKRGSAGDPHRLRVTGDFADVTTIRLAFRIQRLEPRAGPVPTLVRAREKAGAADREHRP